MINIILQDDKLTLQDTLDKEMLTRVSSESDRESTWS
jgi:hypothetical protein